MLNRSFLFAPGNHARRVEKAFTLGADAVILDLEDAVAVSEKAAARSLVAAALSRPRNTGASGTSGTSGTPSTCRGYVRVNAMGTPYCYRDLVEVVGKGVDGVVLPKVESAADLHAIDWLIANLEAERGLETGAIDLMPIIESAAGMSRVDRIFAARSLKPYSGRWRVRRAAFGAADYSHDLNLSPSLDEDELADARARLVLASRNSGLEPPMDSPWFHLKETAAFERALVRSKRNGFQGRLCIHPDQVAAVNRVFSPTAEEIARAARIVAAFAEAEAKGLAAIQVDGQMIDYPIANQARRLLEIARSGRNEGVAPPGAPTTMGA